MEEATASEGKLDLAGTNEITTGIIGVGIEVVIDCYRPTILNTTTVVESEIEDAA